MVLLMAGLEGKSFAGVNPEGRGAPTLRWVVDRIRGEEADREAAVFRIVVCPVPLGLDCFD